MKFAQIKNGIVENCIVLEDESLIDVFKEDFDFFINIDEISPQPSIGWLYDAGNNTFTNEATKDAIDNISKINTIVLFDKYGLDYFQYDQVRQKIREIVISKIMGGIPLTEEEVPVVCKWVLVKYGTRVAVVGEAQDKENWKILVEETIGYKKEELRGRKRLIEEMRQFIGDYLRTEKMTKAQIDDFYITTAGILDALLVTNSPNFWEWVNNDPTTSYKDDGFKQKDYYSDEKKDALNNIMNGNY